MSLEIMLEYKVETDTTIKFRFVNGLRDIKYIMNCRKYVEKVLIVSLLQG